MAPRTWIALGTLAAACARPLPPQLTGGSEAPMTITDNGSLLVPVVLYDRHDAAGQHHRFVVDTGASITALTPSAAEALGLAGTDVLVVNEGQDAALGRTATLPRLSVGGIAFDGLRVAIVDLPDMRRIDARIAGILGLDVLARHDVVIDLARGRLGLHPAGRIARSDAARAMARVPFDQSRYGLVVLAARFQDKPSMPAILDLGAQASVINLPAARMLTRHLYGSATNPEWGSTKLELSDLWIERRGFMVQDLGVFRRLGVHEEPAILLGADLFRDRMVVLAYQDRAVYVSR